MSLFGKSKKQYPKFPEGDLEPVLRCSICTGEQVVCARDRSTGQLQELMMIRNEAELDAFCEANGLRASELRKVY